MGFYPVCPGSTEYAIGSPLVISASIRFENGKTLEIKTVNQSEENLRVSEVSLNGERLAGSTIDHNMLTEGGTLVFIMKK